MPPARSTLPGDWRPVYQAGRQGRKVLGLWLLAWAIAAACVWAAWGLWTDAEAPSPAEATLVWGLGLAFALAMEGYRWLYVSALDVSPGGWSRVRVHRGGRPRHLTFAPGALAAGAVRTGEWEGNGMSGAAPWVSLRGRGHRLPLLLDLQGDVLDARAFARLMRVHRSVRPR